MTPSREPVGAVILAAGRATRMGRTKQLLRWRERPLLQWVVGNVRAAGFERIAVVLGHAADRIRREVDLTGVTVVVNPRYGDGQSTSLIAGLEALASDPGCTAVMFLLADQPRVGSALLRRLLDAYHRSQAGILIPTWQGRRGNPVIIARSLFADLRQLTGDAGARRLFAARSDRLQEVPVDGDAVLHDVDTWEDFQRLQGL